VADAVLSIRLRVDADALRRMFYVIRAAPGRRDSDATVFSVATPARRTGSGEAITALRFE